ncbi:MAG: response regulator [Anaerolineales bacterium]|nr:response regulator [Anaerolineales bacterium]MCA9928740.1 response regulator [Anaerolineales bacterium]
MSKVILIVDDEPMIRHLLQCLLSMDGFLVKEACDGLDALDQVENLRPDLILLDYMMPNLDGLATCRKLRSQPETADVPIIMLSANAQPSVIEQSVQAGVNSFLDKSGNISTNLTHHINNVLDNQVLH